MKRVSISNMNTGQILADNVMRADNFFTRLRGLLGIKRLDPGQGIMIIPCNMVHTVGMSISIDVLFIDKAGEILHIIEAMPPNRFSPHVKKAHYVIELPAGQVKQKKIEIGDRILIS